MRMLSYVFETSLVFSEEVTRHAFVLRCLPKNTNTQKVMESQVFTNPSIQLSEQIDGFGNRIVSGYCPQAHDSFSFYASGLAMSAPEEAGPTPAHPMHRQFTPLTLASKAIAEAAHDVAVDKGLDVPDASKLSREEIWALCVGLCQFVYHHFEYAPGETDVHTPAADAFERAHGVCQDYSHVLISLCREMGVPARYVTGLMQGEGATHAWVEIHDGYQWRGLDPTNDRKADDHYLLFATGRDFSDCPIERGVFRGNAMQTQMVSASVGDGPGIFTDSQY